MRRATWSVFLGVVLLVTAAVGLSAEAKVQQRTQFKLEGMLGKMAGMFGGKAAKEGVVTTVAVKGNRRMSTNDTTAELVDLDAEKVYKIDLRGKSYTVQTFDEIRKEFAKNQAKAQQEVAKEKPDGKQPEMEIEIDVKKTGQQKTLAGYSCDQVILTLIMHEKGKTVEQGGGMTMVSDMWMAPKVEAMQDNLAFEMRYMQKLYGPEGIAAVKDLAQAMAMYPNMKPAMARLQQEGSKLNGTPLLTTMTVSGAGSPEGESAGSGQTSGGGMAGALGGMFGKKKPAAEPSGGSPGGSKAATLLTTVTEVLSIGSSAAEDVEIPAGFKQK